MKLRILVVVVILSCTLSAYSQQSETSASSQTSASSSTSASAASNSLELASGTQFEGELQNTIDVRRAKVGDKAIVKTTKAIKSGKQIIVGKGAKLFGRVTEVSQKTKADAVSRVGLVFDRLENGSLSLPISATITSITAARTSARAGEDESFATDMSVGSSSSARASSGQSGGVIGGVAATASGVLNKTTATAGNVVSGTTTAVGSTVNSTTHVVGTTASGVGRSLGRIQISESSSTSAEGGAVLSLRGDNIRLEKGTNFNLRLNQTASAGTAKDQ